MQTRTIGSLEVSAIGLGTNNFGTDFFGKRCEQDDVTRVINAALDAGVTFIDTAEEYSTVTEIGTGHSEEFIGVALGARRDEAIIATKFENKSHEHPDQKGADRIIRAVEGSLRRLRTDRIDLLQQHFPDPETPREVIIEAMDQLVREGKVREIGCSNYSGEMLDDAIAISAEKGFASFVSSQNNYNLLEAPRQEGIIDACRRHGVMLLPYFPLASGMLTGKYRRGEAPSADTRLGADAVLAQRLAGRALTDERFDTVEKLEAFAADHGHSLLELAFSWLVSQPYVGSVIAGATRPEQIVSNAEAASWELSADDFAAIAAITGQAAPVV
jgi:aryl-alcohol dehydrogenase-like predicted oxidoreductase